MCVFLQNISHCIIFSCFSLQNVWKRTNAVCFISRCIIDIFYWYDHETFRNGLHVHHSVWGKVIVSLIMDEMLLSCSWRGVSSVSASAGRLCGIQPPGSAGFLQSGQTESLMTADHRRNVQTLMFCMSYRWRGYRHSWTRSRDTPDVHYVVWWFPGCVEDFMLKLLMLRW